MISIDFETFCEIDIKAGVRKYVEHDSFRIICLAYAIDKKPVQLWKAGDPVPPELTLSLSSDIIWAFNATFERVVLNKMYGLFNLTEAPLVSSYRCSMALANYNGYGGGLDAMTELCLSDEHKKDKTGKRLINKLCKPRKPSKFNLDLCWTPATAKEDFEAFYEYCRQDVVAEIALRKSFLVEDLPFLEQLMWEVNEMQNDRGFYVDQNLVQAVLDFDDKAQVFLKQRIASITGGQIKSPGQNAKLAAYLGMDNVQKATVEEALSCPDLSELKREILQIKRASSKTSISKFKRIKDTTRNDGTITDYIKYYGAVRTGRFSGSGLQIQNLPRASFDDDEVAAMVNSISANTCSNTEDINNTYDTSRSLIRASLTAKPGSRLIVADYSSIEYVLLMHYVDDKQALANIKAKVDPYKFYASNYLYNKPMDELTKGERQHGKVSMLALGYQMGAKTYQDYAALLGVILTPQQAKKDVNVYRSVHRNVVKFWYNLYKAAESSILTGERVKQGPVEFAYIKGNLYMKLPSGRLLSYIDCKKTTEMAPWGEEHQTLTYLHYDKGKYRRTSTSPGKLVGNCIQAIAGDVLRYGIYNVHTAGYNIIATVHDEVICDEVEGFGSYQELEYLMTLKPNWGPDLPLSCEGFETRRYTK